MEFAANLAAFAAVALARRRRHLRVCMSLCAGHHLLKTSGTKHQESSMTERKHLIAWLRDAHGMERATIDNIERLLKRMKDHPAFVERYKQHLEESHVQLVRVENALRALDADVSVVKDTATRISGWVEAYAAAASDDEPVKHALAAYAYEHFEVASYAALIAAAENLDEIEIADACRQSLAEERAMADWLEDFIPEAARVFLQREAAEERTSKQHSSEARA
jgi:ferritin-like metal-binding protein YciE